MDAPTPVNEPEKGRNCLFCTHSKLDVPTGVVTCNNPILRQPQPVEWREPCAHLEPQQ